MDNKVAARVWLAGTPMQDIQALVGPTVAVEDAIRLTILEAANYEPGAAAGAVERMERETIVAARETKTQRPETDEVKPEPKKWHIGKAAKAATTAQASEDGKYSDYPASLRDPRAATSRGVWDCLGKGWADAATIRDYLFANCASFRPENPEKAVLTILYGLADKGLLRKVEGTRPAMWERVDG